MHVSNQVMSNWKSTETSEITGAHATGTLVDISDLKGREFTPGCASAKPKIDAIISKYDKEVDFVPKKLHQSTSHRFDRVREHIAKGYYNTASLRANKLSNMAKAKFQNDDPIKYKIKVERFKDTEKDFAKVEKFAAEQDKTALKQNAGKL